MERLTETWSCGCFPPLRAGHMRALQVAPPALPRCQPLPPPHTPISFESFPLKTAFLPCPALNVWPLAITDYESDLRCGCGGNCGYMQGPELCCGKGLADAYLVTALAFPGPLGVTSRVSWNAQSEEKSLLGVSMSLSMASMSTRARSRAQKGRNKAWQHSPQQAGPAHRDHRGSKEEGSSQQLA